MSTLAPDEKLCPFCAETIKAAAVKCRFCQSDLSEVPVTVAAATAPEVAPAEVQSPEAPAATVDGAEAAPDYDEPGSEPESEPDPAWLAEIESDEPPTGSRGAPVVAALLVLCLALGGALFFVVHQSRHPDLGTAPNGQVTDNSFRNAAMSFASDAATQALSYSWKTFDQDRAKARALMGAKLVKQYDAAMDQVARQTATSKLTLKATVLSAGILSAKKHTAKVLLFVNTLTTRDGSKKQQLDQNRVVMTLTRKDGDWTVSQMDAF